MATWRSCSLRRRYPPLNYICLEKDILVLELHFIWVARPSNFSSKVTFSDTIRPACLPDDPTETYGYKVGTYTVQSLWLIARLNLFSFGFLPLGKYKRHSRAICHSLYGFSIKAHQWKSTIWMSQPYILVCSVLWSLYNVLPAVRHHHWLGLHRGDQDLEASPVDLRCLERSWNIHPATGKYS